MAPTLIVLGLLVLGVAIVAWATRRKPGQPRVVRHEQDIVWNDPASSTVGPLDKTPLLTPLSITPPSLVQDSDPFAGAPLATPLSTTEPRP